MGKISEKGLGESLNRRLNIGLLVDDIDAVFTSPAVQGAELGARAIDANLFIVPGRYLDNVDEFQKDRKYGYQYNTLFEYVKNSNIDVLYVMMGMIGARVDEDVRIGFLKKFGDIPIVTMYTRTKGYPSIIFDNKCAFIQGITHIIRNHHAKKLGFVSGPLTNVDAQERLEAYREALEKEGIPYNEDYIAYGNFEESSEGIIGEFIDRHPELDAMIFANDRMAFAGYRACEKRGIRPGEDIAILGFDNSEFAPGLNPPLSTVEANAAELAYKAIIQAEKFYNRETNINLYVDTRLILRESCGCAGINIESIISQTCMDGILDKDERENTHVQVCDYLFNDYIDSHEAENVKKNVVEFLDTMAEWGTSGHVRQHSNEMEKSFSKLLVRSTFRYTTLEQVSNILSALQVVLCNELEADQKLELMQVFVDLLRKLSLQNWKMIYSNNAGVGRMSRFMNNMTADMFRMDSGERIPYDRALSNLAYVDIASAYLFLYEEPVHHSIFTGFELPQKIKFKAYFRDNEAYKIGKEDQDVATNEIFSIDKIPGDRRVTMVLSLLFSAEDIFGVLLCEAGLETFRNIDPVSVHISTAIKSMSLLRQQDKVQTRLEETMAKLIENNDALQVISKTDQLTGLLNRWGFMEAVQKCMENSGADSRGMFMYADMDGLKSINDTYGHDDGDFALKSMTSILRQACDSEAIVSRFGGDEFVVFSAIEDVRDIDRLKNRIWSETEILNSSISKPYRIEMSTGVCEVECSPELDIYQALATADRLLYQEKRAKKLRRMGNIAVTQS